MKTYFLFVFIFLVFLFSCVNKQKEKEKQITFSEHIAPIIYKNCAPCHRPGSVAPFSLLTFKDVVGKAKTIKLVTGAGIMPPWPADPTYSHFVGEKILSREEINRISTWVDNKCPRGDSSLSPPPPHFPTGSMLGKPDLRLTMNKAFFIKGDNKDRFMLMKFPYEVGRDTFIRMIEFVPWNKKLVHHANGFLIHYEEKKKKNVYEGEHWVDAEVNDYKRAYETMKIPQDDGSYPVLTPSAVNYLPGVLPVVYPKGLGGFHMKRKGAIFLKDIHYGPSSTDQLDSSYFNVFFSATPPKRPLLELQMGTFGVSKIIPPLKIPPDSVKKFITKFLVPMDISLVTINPHMHLLGKSFLAYAIKPNGDTIPLIRIKKWDFRWQYFYTFPRMLRIPAGSTIYAEGIYDNTAKNPLNPFNPPKEVGEREGSMRTTDEMFQFIINYVPYLQGDENISLEGKIPWK